MAQAIVRLDMCSPRTELTLCELSARGWCYIPAPANEPEDILAALGPILSLRSGSSYHDLIPYDKESAPPFSMSATIGTDAQPMHTDAAYYPLPPRYVALQCLETGKTPCPTHVWTADLARLRIERPQILTKPIWVAQGGSAPAFYCSVMEIQFGEIRLRFDAFCMRAVAGGSQTVAEAQQVLNSYLQPFTVDWTQGALLIIDNWRCLHARGNGGDRARSRRLRRWYLGVDHGLVA